MAVSYSLRHWRCWSWPQKETKGDQNYKRAPPHHLLETSLVRKCEKMRRKTNMRDRRFSRICELKEWNTLNMGMLWQHTPDCGLPLFWITSYFPCLCVRNFWIPEKERRPCEKPPVVGSISEASQTTQRGGSVLVNFYVATEEQAVVKFYFVQIYAIKGRMYLWDLNQPPSVPTRNLVHF